MGGKSLRLSRETIDECVKACDELIDGLRVQQHKARSLQYLSGFGSLDSAQQLKAGFERKGHELYDRLEQFIEAATRMRNNFAAGGVGFEQMEQEFSQALRGIDREINQ
ncbi:hypothetical protein G4X40_14845 [Rhodococcus sp. D2-41]|uniref:hypothetical protein n=1 Tax=Speluncibacter jeojiensis TaxID=2710754 RepID=UPI00240F1CF9|nr:hypothetical protein [Rhodococcus sp. D2-41]MDG3011425.1 hypothetical protein [Rhodococcus sp. D2-41]